MKTFTIAFLVSVLVAVVLCNEGPSNAEPLNSPDVVASPMDEPEVFGDVAGEGSVRNKRFYGYGGHHHHHHGGYGGYGGGYGGYGGYWRR